MYKISLSQIKTIVCFFLVSSFSIFSLKSQTFSKIPITAVTASSWETLANGGYGDYLPENAVDGDDGTSFRTEGHGEWIMFDLGESIAIAHIKLKFLKGDQRIYTIDVEVADVPAGKWDKVLDQEESSGTATSLEIFDLNVSGRYIKVIGYGNTNTNFSEWFNIVEAEVYKQDNVTQINTKENTLSFSLYPNPCTTQNLTIHFSEFSYNSEFKIQLIEITGRMIRLTQELKNNNGKNTAIVDAANLKNGIYILNVTNGVEAYKRKLIINK